MTVPELGDEQLKTGPNQINGHVVHYWSGPTMWAWSCECRDLDIGDIGRHTERDGSASARAHCIPLARLTEEPKP
jgi:hypothetical protein